MPGGFRRGVQWGVDRVLSVGYGLMYDYIFERFGPYQALRREVLHAVEAAVPAGIERRDVRVLDVGCGPGNFSLMLAEAGFTVVGLDGYDALVTLAQEKRRAQRLPNVAFKQGSLTENGPFPPEQFDQLINIHFLYADSNPTHVLRAAHRALKPGGHAVFVNLTRRVPVWTTFQALKEARGLQSAVAALLWVLPNSLFETFRRQTGPHYWNEPEFRARLEEAGFEVADLRRTFFDDASLIATARKPMPAAAAVQATG
ncbi:MAG TPA: methyltransferase domain-containing protein [Methylomirabilota bacterium]|jgi:2-polyprenyl-3-methyl-5-hydroxy-6-metoxy-1,4-benzoquinol methylase|nr:methyltransferase domain-containing protein [Methylomirabilota bacterium]